MNPDQDLRANNNDQKVTKVKKLNLILLYDCNKILMQIYPGRDGSAIGNIGVPVFYELEQNNPSAVRAQAYCRDQNYDEVAAAMRGIGISVSENRASRSMSFDRSVLGGSRFFSDTEFQFDVMEVHKRNYVERIGRGMSRDNPVPRDRDERRLPAEYVWVPISVAKGIITAQHDPVVAEELVRAL